MVQGGRAAARLGTAMFAALFFLTAALLAALCFTGEQKDIHADKTRREYILALNEIEKLTETDGASPAQTQIAALRESLTQDVTPGGTNAQTALIGMYLICVLALVLSFFYLYHIVIKPFQRLEKYAGELARGNFEIELHYERQNIFGAFTWAFDHMRVEIARARDGERLAVENHKTVIATLSHDIKTPVASIRAYTEALAANMDTSAERRARYASVILKKCDEVTALTNDLFLHSLSDMDKLQIQCEPTRIDLLLRDTLAEQLAEEPAGRIPGESSRYGKTSSHITAELQSPLPPVIVSVDAKRFRQAVGNLLANAEKYAPQSAVRIWLEAPAESFDETEYCCALHIRDDGPGPAPEDVPFLFDKFYRGKNVGAHAGAGLGLYIVKYVMRQMGGDARIADYRKGDGLEIVLLFSP